MLKQVLAGYIQGNQVIRLQSAEGAIVIISLHVQAKAKSTARGFTNTKSKLNYPATQITTQ